MCTLNKPFAIMLIASLVAHISCKSDAVEVTEVEKNIVDTNAEEIAVLTQLKSINSDSKHAIYTYKCTVGTYSSNRSVCIARDSTSWIAPHNVELKLRCPMRGSGVILSYVEIVYSVSSPSVNCFVNEGAVGLRYIGVTLNAWNTLIFSYTANFYTY